MSISSINASPATALVNLRTRVAVLGREALYSINHLKKFWFISQPGMKNMFILDSIQIMNANVFFGHIKF
ncbi:hypothetical protein JHK82_053753 [Glycine max]|uniref:Uncharacterized protein n=1 Tax=Glycine max TaxID=3847 RepID=K7MYL4_SOYBN|nr:hypothetical protein JHK86_053601 [Glycine max]KAG4916108.1 hypothetical protein JHK87_053665 [Glycine soja]KAG5083588.1 hypothetical protein JHK84_053626 [Glycine max]KAG5086356.1 hypothetical protein JHK82_053753 [Glycine max]KAH1078019.1 hypothetical protein GYH30_053195 [Glycine max]